MPIARTNKVFLSHCKVSVTPEDTVDAIARFSRTVASAGVDYEDKDRCYRSFRSRAATLLGATTSDIAFMVNTAHGIHAVCNGLTWERGDNVVITDSEFSDNVHPWLALARYGVETRVARSVDHRISAEHVLELVDRRTRLVSVSHVQYLTGYRMDVATIGRHCRTEGVWFLIDAAQSAGVVGLDVREVECDFIAVGGHKWLLGPLGSGILYCRPQALAALAVTTVDADRLEDVRDASRLEIGAAKNNAGIYGLDASLGLLLDLSVPRIEARVLELTAWISTELARRGHRIVSPMAIDAERSGIVTFAPRSEPAEVVVKRVAAHGVMVTNVGANVRVAPHCYNSIEDLERLIAALDSR